MQTQRPPSPEIALDQLAQAFEQWRASKSSRVSRIPDALLDQAQMLSQQLPAFRVLKRLRLSASQVQRRKVVASTSSAPDFISLASSTALLVKPNDTHCPQVTPLTLRLNHGPTLTLAGLPMPQLVDLLTALLER